MARRLSPLCRPTSGKYTWRKQLVDVTAVEVIQHTEKFFLFQMKASELFKLTKINQRVEGKEEGYQRVLSPGRVKAVARYIRSGGLIPGAIVVSFPKLKYDGQNNLLSISEDQGWIIDGQHRLAGAYEARDIIDIDLPVVAFSGLSDGRQVELFITINKEAKNVPSSLYIDLLSSLPRQKSEKELLEERIADIARTLNNDESSPFFQRLIFTRTARAGEISITNFARVTRPLFLKNGGTLSPYTQTEQVGVINNYFKALLSSFPKYAKPESSVFFRTVGFGAVWRAFPFVFNHALADSKASNVKAFTAVFREIAGFNFDNWAQYGSGSAAEVQAGDDLLEMLQDAYAGGEHPGIGLKLD